MQRFEKIYRRSMKNYLDWLVDGEFVATDHRVRISAPQRSSANNPLKLHRARFSHLATMPFPDSLVARDRATGEVYLCGQTNVDGEGGPAYVGVTVVHRVTPRGPKSSTGIAQIVRRVATGTEEDPGWLDNEESTDCYADVVLSTTVQETDTYQLDIGRFVVYLPQSADIRRYDFIHLNDYTLRVRAYGPDSGFLAVHCDAEEDDRRNIVYIRETGRQYDRETGGWTTGEQRYNITAVITEYNETLPGSSQSDDSWSVAIEEYAIGFTPESGDHLEIGDRTLEIVNVDFEPGNRQYKLQVR